MSATASTSSVSQSQGNVARLVVDRLGRVWEWLTEPNAVVVGSEQRRRARLLAGMLVFIIPLGFIGVVIIPLATVPTFQLFNDPFVLAVIVAEVLMTACYILSRTRYHATGAPLLILTISGTIFFGIRTAQDPLPLIMYLGLNTLLASLLMPLRTTVIVGFLSTASVLLPPLLRPQGLSVSSETNAFTFVLITSILTIAASDMRNRDLHRIETQSNELAAAVRQAQLASKLKDQFLANMSHELRTPLNAIIGFTEVMLMGLAGDLPAQAKRATERIHANSERLLKLIDDILDISKIEAGRVDIHKRPFEPAELLNTIETSIRPQAAKNELSLITELDPALPREMVGDAKRLEQILLNLASNAVKFTERGSITVSLKRLNEQEWAVVVSDTGIGIPPHAQETIFEKFRQVDGSTRRAYSGTGLGLAIVRELALLMDGNVKVKSTLGSGSTFTVTFPLIVPEKTKSVWTNLN